jgi:hypothetical protein
MQQHAKFWPSKFASVMFVNVSHYILIAPLLLLLLLLLLESC